MTFLMRRLAAMLMLASVACGGDGGTVAPPPPPPPPPPAPSTAPVLIATVPVPASYGIHDTFVRDGIAFVSAWNTGLILYDVGDGRAGGSPSAPVELSRIVTTVTNTTRTSPSTHNAWWFHNPVTNERRYVFVGEEGPGIIGRSSSGDIHVVDISDIRAPREVATFHMPATGGGMDSAGVHNFWMDEAAQVLYAAYYNRGVVAIDVSGTLSGNISSRLIAQTQPGGSSGTYTWGVMLANGALYASDMLSGFWQLRLNGNAFTTVSGGNNVPERFGSDLWVLGDAAYTGTWGGTSRMTGVEGNALKVWRLSGTGAPTLADSVLFAGASTVGDVEATSDGRHLLVTLERGAQAGFEILSLANRLRPVSTAKVVVATGVHTGSFAVIGGRRYVFLAKNPASPALLIYDVTAATP